MNREYVDFDTFITNLKKYYEIEIKYKPKDLVENIRDDYRYCKEAKENILKYTDEELIHNFTEEDFYHGNDPDKFLCYILFKKGLTEEAYIKYTIRGKHTGVEYWFDCYKYSMLFLGTKDGKTISDTFFEGEVNSNLIMRLLRKS